MTQAPSYAYRSALALALLSTTPLAACTEKADGPAVGQFVARFTPLLAKEPSLVIRDREEDVGADKGVSVIAKLHPKSAQGFDDILRQIGEHLWKSKFDGKPVRSVTAQWRDPKTGEFTAMRLKKPGKKKVLDLFTETPEVAPKPDAPKPVPGR